MDFSNIKLVVSDMDGTLLNSRHEVSTKFLNQFQQLKNKNIHFVAASGRQFQSILSKFPSINNDISIIAENGAVMKYKDETNVLLQLSLNQISDCISRIREIKNSHIVLCGRKTAYIESKDSSFISKLREYYTEASQVDDLTQVTDDEFLKIAVFHFDSSEEFVYPYLQPIVNQVQVIVSAQNWVDISHKEANKSFALKQIQKNLGVTPEQTMIFGDYNNDIEMMKLAQFSYAMSNAHPRVKEVANYATSSNDNHGVETVLEKLLSARS
ncbi:Cof-type HAD-IIB family hydrolase [Psychroflexus sp. CAK57W]|uniref:HAD family hydrolase n=1 Tax=Psychroflexus curvus TaxID=2873595 RepID=UPI001CCB38D3|nr:HAD family hydrolase [Psychroflexus curvus]MBZ9787612.1 Cof-type HAD-IIB family hydrolase [Psychroflexus curvus]